MPRNAGQDSRAVTTASTVGVLGGMGLDATMAFLNRVLALTAAKKDWDHIYRVVDKHRTPEGFTDA
jgi:aspartate/glutamate racemase